MKKIITALFCTALALSSAMTAYAAEAADRDTIETAIWDDIWNGKGDNGLDYPEASYKHHILDKWLDDNYGSDEYDWSEIGELKYAYKRYYRNLIYGWDFKDDDNGGWTIETEDNFYSFTLLNGNWQMIDRNGNTVDSFPPFSTLEEGDAESSSDVYEINDEGADSPRVVGQAASGADNDPDSASNEDVDDTPDSSGLFRRSFLHQPLDEQAC